jgi:hypothetical protein
VTATGLEDVELTPLEDWMVFDELDELEEFEEVEVVAEFELDEDEADAAAVPGIVWALMTAKTPTPSAPRIEMPTVSR